MQHLQPNILCARMGILLHGPHYQINHACVRLVNAVYNLEVNGADTLLLWVPGSADQTRYFANISVSLQMVPSPYKT